MQLKEKETTLRSTLQSWWELLSTHVFSETNLFVISSVSLLMLVASLVLVPWVIVRLPADYFTRQRAKLRHDIRQGRYGRSALRLARSVLGVIVLIAGILMLVLPGQGLLAILVAVLLIEFPGKHRVQHRLLGVKGVKPSADWLRGKFAREPFEI